MNINRQFLARSVLAFGAIMRTVDPAPLKPFSNYESQIKLVETEVDIQQPKSKDSKHKKLKFPFARGRQRRPYIQFEDGSYKIL